MATDHTPQSLIRRARIFADALDIGVRIFAILGLLGAVAMFNQDLQAAGLGALLGVGLTAGVAWSLVHGLRLLAVLVEASADRRPTP